MLTKLYGRGGGGRVAIVLSFYFDDPSLNPDIVHNFYGKVVWKELRKQEDLQQQWSASLEFTLNYICHWIHKRTKIEKSREETGSNKRLKQHFAHTCLSPSPNPAGVTVGETSLDEPT